MTDKRPHETHSEDAVHDDAPPTPAVSDEVEEEAARAEQTHDGGSQD